VRRRKLTHPPEEMCRSDGTEIAPQLDIRIEYELYAGAEPGLPADRMADALDERGLAQPGPDVALATETW